MNQLSDLVPRELLHSTMAIGVTRKGMTFGEAAARIAARTTLPNNETLTLIDAFTEQLPAGRERDQLTQKISQWRAQVTDFCFMFSPEIDAWFARIGLPLYTIKEGKHRVDDDNMAVAEWALQEAGHYREARIVRKNVVYAFNGAMLDTQGRTMAKIIQGIEQVLDVPRYQINRRLSLRIPADAFSGIYYQPCSLSGSASCLA